MKQTREEFVEKMKKQLDKWNEEIAVLEEKVQNTKENIGDKYNAQIVTLRAKYHEGEMKLKTVKDASADTWEKLKSETENIFTAFSDSLKTFRSHFK